VFFGILGATEVRGTDGSPTAVGGPRVRSLLALLLLDAGHLVTAERLIDGLYGEDPPRDAANALQSQVSRLRRGLGGDGALVEFHPAGYRLAVDPDSEEHMVDVHRFGRLAGEGRRALAAGDHAKAAELLRTALDLWRGPALADVMDAPFAAAQAARLDEQRLAAVEDHAEAALALGGHRELVAELHDLVAAHPLRERARGLLMRALYGSGRQAQALEVFEDARRRLADELGTDPSAELAEIHLAVLRGDPSLTAPAARTLPPTSAPTGPPAQLTSFVGRDEELRRIAKSLADGRLVTLIGPGGAGKTRLAIEAAAREQGEVCFVDLAPLGSRSTEPGTSSPAAGTTVPQAVVSALGLRETGLLPSSTGADHQPDPVGRLIAALADRRTLLVLDNCEHVIDEAARLINRLLGACPGVRVLATSREPLAITGESLRPVPPLALPPSGVPPGDALGYPAVRLFADRAAAVRPEFELAEANADGVVRICAALDGLPLAIELAAARVRSLPVAEIEGRLTDRFRLLSRGSRTAAPRHQTLYAVVKWSWDLLDEAERTLARRLTVFAGGATPQAAAQVCDLPAEEVDELLAGLVDKSLVELADGRFRMLDTIRAFCAEQLAEAGERERLRRAHAAFFLDLARSAEPRLYRAEQLEWLARLAAEHGNLLGALRWAIASKTAADTDLALRLVAALSSYWYLRGLRSESAPLAVELLDSIGPEPPEGLAEEYVLCVLNAVASGAQEAALGPHWARMKSIVTTWDSPPRHSFVIVLWAQAVGISGADMLDESVLGDDPWSQALAQVGGGFLGLYGGDMTVAEREFDLALDGFRSIGDRWGMATALDTLSLLADWRGDAERARALLDEALDLLGQLGALEELAGLWNRRAEGLLRSGAPAAARADYEHGLEVARRGGAPDLVAGAHRGLAEIARLDGDLAEARDLYELALSESPSGWIGMDETRLRILIGLGWLDVTEGRAGEALARHREALTGALAQLNFPCAAGAIEGLSGVALLEGDGERAALLLGAGAALRGVSVPGDPDVDRVVAGSRRLIGAAAYAAAYERGAALSRDEALATVGAAAPSAFGARPSAGGA
jgi:predicted ATPase/DNA-binding SARP family transcriptional activator